MLPTSSVRPATVPAALVPPMAGNTSAVRLSRPRALRGLGWITVAALSLLLSACVGEEPASSSSSGGSVAASGGATGGASAGGAGSSSAVAPVAAADKTAAVTLTWWTGQDADAEKVLEGLAATFHALHPNVTLKVSAGASTTDELLQKLSAGFAADSYPDISYAFGSWASQLGESGKTLDITGNVADPAVGWSEFPEAARLTAQPAGRTIGFPAIVDNLGLFYNTTVFDAAGVAYPTKDWTWQDFRTAAKKLTNPAKNIYGTAMAVNGSEDTTWHMWPQLWQNGGAILSTDDKHAAFNSDAGVTAVTFWRDLAQSDKSVYLDQTGEKYGPLFVSNNIGMLLTGPWQISDLATAKTKYGVTVLPGANGNHETVSGPDLWVLLDHQDADRGYWSYELLRWLTAPEQDAQWNMSLGNLPLRSASRTTPAFATAEKQFPGYAVLADNLDNAVHKRPTVTGYVGLSAAYGKAVAEVLQGKGDPKAALDAAAKAADLALAGQ
jgi:multiple sugar transport system substrate-binding protein